MSDINASGREEHIRAEVMLINVVSLEHSKYRWLDQSSDNPPKRESAENGDHSRPRGSTETVVRKLVDGFQCLSPIPPSGEGSSRA